MAGNYKTIALYGGAISVQLPSDFKDVSDLREVPDHQEVFVSGSNLTSIIFDLVERAEPPSHPCITDDEALYYHFEDIVDAGYRRQDRGSQVEKEETKHHKKEQMELKNLPNVTALSLVSSQHPRATEEKEDSNMHKEMPDFIAILMTLVRLTPQKTDLLITINVPHVLGDYKPEEVDLENDKRGPLLEAAFDDRQKICESLKVEEWGLFVTQ